MGNKQLPLESRLLKQTEKNKRWFNLYEQSLISDNKSSGTIGGYLNTIINLMEFNGNKDIYLVDLDTIGGFIYETNGGNRANFKISAIKGFLSIVSIDEQLSFEINEIEMFRISKDEVDSTARASIPLTIQDIIKIRYLLKDDYARAYVFEMFYQYGLSVHELPLCNEKTYDSQTKAFKLPDGRNVYLSEMIIEFISENSKLLRKKTKAAYQNNVSEIGDKIGRNLTWQDIMVTRDKYFFTCPVCEKQYENTPGNWALALYEKDIYKTKWIICKDCAMKGESYGKSNSI